jgi:hypothetical protein
MQTLKQANKGAADRWFRYAPDRGPALTIEGR